MIVALFVGLSVSYWVGVLLVCGQAGFPLDDAYIHLQFARNLVTDGQMAFNAGVPNSGSTAPLYPVLLAGLYRLANSWFVASVILGAITSLGTALVVYGIVLSWTGRGDLARWAGVIAVLLSPTIVQAYNGMESPVYSLLFLLGLWCWPNRGLRLMGSLCWAVGMWLRPEFVVLTPLIALERFWDPGRKKGARLVGAIRDVAPHALIWIVLGVAFVAYHHAQDGHWAPTTFAAKSLAPWPPCLSIVRESTLYSAIAFVVWPVLVLLTVFVGMIALCPPLGLGLWRALKTCWWDDSAKSTGWRMAVLVFIGYPLLRGAVDALGVFTGFFPFQQMRYYAHIVPLAAIIAIGALPATGIMVDRTWWTWATVPVGRQLRRAACWAAVSCLVIGAMSVAAVSNINTMQVAVGEWLRDNTDDGALIATNDIGAIAFVSRREVLDLIGLVEPGIIEHYRAGGKPLEYLRQRRPDFVVLLPNWYPALSQRADVLEELHSVELTLNVMCGGPVMKVYRAHWSEP